MAFDRANLHQPEVPLWPSSYTDHPELAPHEMESPDSPVTEVEELFERLETYSKTTFELAKLKSLEVTTGIVTSLVSKLSVGVAIGLFLILINVGLSIYLGELLGKAYYGFFLVAAIDLLLAILLHLFIHPLISKSLGQSMIRNFTNGS